LKTFIKHKKRSLQNEESKDSDSNKENISVVANPPITKHRSRPETKRYKAATEKVTENVLKKAPEKVTGKACRQLYTCRSCGKTGHNSVKCPKK
ncbi:40635_t:CDS:1, partial [Gigaspora margarita]